MAAVADTVGAVMAEGLVVGMVVVLPDTAAGLAVTIMAAVIWAGFTGRVMVGWGFMAVCRITGPTMPTRIMVAHFMATRLITRFRLQICRQHRRFI